MNGNQINGPLVKICGISEPEHAEVAVNTGANFIGLVFYPPSHRYVTTEQAAEVVKAVRDTDRSGNVEVFGLFVNEHPERINRLADTLGLDRIQLHGDETPDHTARLTRPTVAALRVDPEHPDEAVNSVQGWIAADNPPSAILIDTRVTGYFGGTGEVGDWAVAADLARRYPVFLAGGLDPENVAAAVEVVKPYAVDVSTGVETDRRKDSVKIKRFIGAARSTRSII